ncbi:MAG: TIGR03620 family F420-dependent LLM class oxidoreductase [Chromatiales bacterium]|jgi:probable F420-dependent oxidoreductase|nr:TIGR03620 family F420-dependent LLM class oxidoreductase [Chromatiales bacterium]
MNPGRLGAWYSSDKLSPAQWREFLPSVESLGYEALWYPESRGFESMAFGSFLLNTTNKMTIGSSIANIYARDAMASAQGMATLNAISGGRYVLGLGVSHVPMVEKLRGHSYQRPVATMRAYLQQMRDHLGADAPFPVVLAALGPKMLELAGEMTAGAVPYNVTPEHTAKAKAILGEGKMLAVEQKVCLQTDPAIARALARAELKRYMALPNYCNNWLREGFTQDDISNDGSDRFMDAMVVWGTADTIRQRLNEHFDAGATHVCIQPVHAEGNLDAAVETLRELAPNTW